MKALSVFAVGLLLQGSVLAASTPSTLRPAKGESAGQDLVLPHDRARANWPLPDYLALTLAIAKQGVDERYRSLRLRGDAAGGAAVIVLPTQGQAFGFSPAFRTILGAYLDRELGARGVPATRQTDIVDIEGPFVRRLDESTVASLAAEHPGKPILAMYVGHDGVAGAFVTLTLRQNGKVLVAHREAPMVEDAWQAAEQFAKLLPALLSELGLGKPANRDPLAAVSSSCARVHWDFGDLPRQATAAERACFAIAVGTLLPGFPDPGGNLTGTMSPARAAWLATAWVEAAALAKTNATFRAIHDLARAQIDLSPPDQRLLAYDDLADPIVEPLLRLVSAAQRFRSSPKASARDAALRYVEPMAVGLPAFARAVFLERARFRERFERVDFCEIEAAFPGSLPRTECGPQRDKRRPATSVERTILQEWRFAAFYKDLVFHGRTRGDQTALADSLRRLPADVAPHPFVQQLRPGLGEEKAMQGSFDVYAERMRASIKTFVQSTANLQAYGAWLPFYSLSEHSSNVNTQLLNEAASRRAIEVEGRLIAVMRYDRYTSPRDNPPRTRVPGELADFLAPLDASPLPAPSSLSARAATNQESLQERRPAPSATQLFSFGPPQDPAASRKRRDEEVRAKPQDLELRVDLALQRLREGATVDEAMEVIDAMVLDRRPEWRVSNSHKWSEPAHVMYFAGELSAARKYYTRVNEIGTGSESDMLATVRVRQLDGDLAGATLATEARLRRYPGDYARRDLAGFLFMAGQTERAWQVLMPRLAVDAAGAVWDAVLVGHRRAGESTSGVARWFDSNRLEQMEIERQPALPMLLHLHAVLDRLPSEDDIAALRRLGAPRWSASGSLLRMALTRKAPSDGLAAWRTEAADQGMNFMLPFYVWVASSDTKARDAALPFIEGATTESAYPELLAKSMLLARARKLDASVRFLRAARFRLVDPRASTHTQPLPHAYQFVLAAHLMAAETGHEAYRQQALALAQAYQKVFPFLAWPYAVEALMGDDAGARSLAACRAHTLDRQSMFLELAQQRYGRTLGACRAKPW